MNYSAYLGLLDNFVDALGDLILNGGQEEASKIATYGMAAVLCSIELESVDAKIGNCTITLDNIQGLLDGAEPEDQPTKPHLTLVH